MNPYELIAQALRAGQQPSESYRGLISAASEVPRSVEPLGVKGGHNPQWWEYLAGSIAPAISRGMLLNAANDERTQQQSEIDTKIQNVARTLQGIQNPAQQQEYLIEAGVPEAALAMQGDQYAMEREKQAQIQKYEAQKQYDPVLARELSRDEYAKTQDAVKNNFESQRLDLDRQNTLSQIADRNQRTSLAQRQAQIEGAQQNIMSFKDVLKTEKELSAEYGREPILDIYATQKSYYGAMKQAFNKRSKIADQDFIIGASKIMDPNSTVLLQEGQKYVDSQTMSDALRGKLNQALAEAQTNQGLSQETKLEIVELAERHVGETIGRVTELNNRYKARVGRFTQGKGEMDGITGPQNFPDLKDRTFVKSTTPEIMREGYKYNIGGKVVTYTPDRE